MLMYSTCIVVEDTTEVQYSISRISFYCMRKKMDEIKRVLIKMGIKFFYIVIFIFDVMCDVLWVGLWDSTRCRNKRELSYCTVTVQVCTGLVVF